MFNNWFCDKCHFYENEECTNSWGCDSELRSHLSEMPKRDVKVTSPKIDLLASYLALHPKRKIKVTSLDKVNLINQHLVLSPDERS